MMFKAIFQLPRTVWLLGLIEGIAEATASLLKLFSDESIDLVVTVCDNAILPDFPQGYPRDLHAVPCFSW